MIIAATEHSALCRTLFARPQSRDAAMIYDGYLAAMDSPSYAQLLGEFDVTTVERVVPLLATWAHECGGFRIMWESGNYTSVERILQKFGDGAHSARITRAEAGRYVRNPYGLFERVYGLGNPHKAHELGNIKSGDGFNFRGCGLQQLTGRRDHERYAHMIGCAVDELCKPINSLHAALLEWRDKHCNALADAGDLRAIRRAINGGMNGWEDFNAKCALLRKHIEHSEYGNDNEVLALGSRGPDVMALQEQLRARGFYENGAVDDTFGAMTNRALIAFQAAHELLPTGQYDERTKLAMVAIPPEPTLPGRKAPDVSRNATIKDRVMLRIDAVWKSILGFLGLDQVAKQSGFDIIEAVMGASDKAQAMLQKLSIQPRFVLYAGAVVVIFFLVRCVSKNHAETTEQIQLGRAQ